jgi:signal transduction histidine kinase
MTAEANVIRTESHEELGALIQRDARVVIERWGQRALEEQQEAKRTHHETLLDHLPQFLQELGRSLAESGEDDPYKHCRPARRHGEQRWQTGWSLSEVVRDYQILRLVLLDYLEDALERPLRSREVMAIGLALDEAITASVNAYVRESAEHARQADEVLRQKAEALLEADRRKDQFLAVLGHELRNPLAPISNAVQVLSLQPADPEAVAWARGVLERQVQHMSRLVDDLLDVSRVARGKIILRHEPIDLVGLVRDAAEDRRGSVAEAGLTLLVDLPLDPLWIEGDPTRLRQAVSNLLQNAVKFTNSGGRIEVKAGRDDAVGCALVCVRDTGIGIEADLLPRLFVTFVQADQSLERSRGGLGLGLALVKGIVELHGGEVRAASDGVGRGSAFTLSLPLAQESPPSSGL